MNTNFSTIVALSGISLAGQLSAATIMGAISADTPSDSVSYDLSALGTSDWAIWHNPATEANSTTVLADPSVSKAGSTIIGNIVPVGGSTTVRSSDSNTRPSTDFSYGSDATTGIGGSVTNAIGYFNSSLNTTDVGVGLSITLPTADTYEVTIFTALFGDTENRGTVGDFEATIGTATYSNSGQTDDSVTAKNSYFYTLLVTSDQPGNILQISNTLSEAGAANSHTLINGAAVRVVPEPSIFAMLSIAGLMAFRRRR